ncbi:MAG: hypothetical protein LBL81_02495, partial [Tannerella sp.]|nr:hypothetical protein [Tannerella sp.]
MKGTYDIWLRRLFLFASAILATACHSHTQEKKEQETHEHGNEAILLSAEKAKEMGLRTITLERGDFTETIKAAGRILPGQGDEQALLARTPGILHYAGPRIAEGQAVKKGEVLFTLSDSLLVEGQISVR